MKRLFLFKGLLLAICLIFVISCHRKNTTIFIVPEIVNLTTLSSGDSIIEFRVINTGRKKILIERIEVPCNCLLFQLSDSIIGINSYSIIRIRNTPSINDGISRPITIYSNAEGNPHIIWLICPKRKDN